MRMYVWYWYMDTYVDARHMYIEYEHIKQNSLGIYKWVQIDAYAHWHARVHAHAHAHTRARAHTHTYELFT